MRYNARCYSRPVPSRNGVAIRFPPIPLHTLFSGFIAVLVGYASSAAIIWQAAAAAGLAAPQIAGWMTMLGIGMGASTLLLTLRWRAPVLTAWSTPGAALLATSLHGVTPGEATGIFIFAAVLIVLCGLSGLFAWLMRTIPHTLAAAMLAGILLRFGLETFGGLRDQGVMCGGMLISWLITRALAPRYAVAAALVVGLAAALLGDNVSAAPNVSLFAAPVWITPVFSLPTLLGIGVPFFLVTMTSQNAPGVAALKAAGYCVPVSPLMTSTGLITLALAPLGVYSISIAAITAAICQSPEAHPDPQRRWQAAAAAGVFYLLAGIAGGGIAILLAALPAAFIHTLAGLALLSALGGSLYQALMNETERDAATVAFLITASGLTLWGISSAFWGLAGGGLCYAVLSAAHRRRR